ncbi:hypothetical protein EMCRGX_G029235 [Ephydatia muelleri]
MAEDSSSFTRSFLETLKVLEKHITCPVCLEVFKEPKTLSCLHTYCRECVNKLIQARATYGDIQCPECRGVVPVYEKDANKFPTSFLMNSLIDTYEKLTKSSDPSMLCENCGKDKATAFCSDCALHICAGCVLCHKTMKKQLELYCQSCEQLICLSCTIIDHKGHNFDFVDTLATVLKSEVQSDIGGIVDKEHSIQQAIVNVENVKEELTKQGNGLEHSICEVFEQLEAALNREKEILLQQTKHMVGAKIGVLSTQAEMLLSTQTAFKSLQSFIQETSENSCNEEFVSLKSQMSARIKELDEKYKSLQLEPKVQATIKYQTLYSNTSTGHQIHVAVNDSEFTCTPLHMEVAIKSRTNGASGDENDDTNGNVIAEPSAHHGEDQHVGANMSPHMEMQFEVVPPQPGTPPSPEPLFGYVAHTGKKVKKKKAKIDQKRW